MRRIAAAAILLCAAGAHAQPYAFIPGSSVDTPETGNRMAVVDLGTRAVVGSAEGWLLHADNAGADPLATNFSPDGRFAYILVGGSAADNLAGRLYVYDVAATVAALGAAGTPAPIQTITYAGNGSDPVEPVAITVDPSGRRAYVVEATQQRIYCYSASTDGGLTETGVIDTGTEPFGVWLKPGGQGGYFPGYANFTLNVVDLREGEEALVASLPTPPPAQTNSATFPACVMGIALPVGANALFTPPADYSPRVGAPITVFSGYFGVKARFLTQNQYIRDDVHIYGVDPFTDELLNGGAPLYTIDPAGDAVIIPPLVTANEEGAAAWTHIGGSQFERAGIRHVLLSPETTLIPLNGMLLGEPRDFFVGSVAVPDAIALIGGSYTPVRSTSALFRVPAGTTANLTLAKVADVDRNTAIVLGTVGDNIVVAGNDALSVQGTVFAPSTPPRDTILYFYDASENATASIALPFVAGSWGQQPSPHEVPYDAADYDGDGFTDQIEAQYGADPLRAASRPPFGDIDGDGATNLGDALAMARRDAGAPYDAGGDIDRDGDVDDGDGKLLFAWAVGNGVAVIPTE